MRTFSESEEQSGLADAMRSRLRYKIVRHYFNGANRGMRRTIIPGGLTLAEAQAWCQDPETSSRTCTKATGKARTRRMGPWLLELDAQFAHKAASVRQTFVARGAARQSPASPVGGA